MYKRQISGGEQKLPLRVALGYARTGKAPDPHGGERSVLPQMCIRDRSEGDRIAYDKAVDRYNVSRIVENDIREQAVARCV